MTCVIHNFAPASQVQNPSIRDGCTFQKRHFHVSSLSFPNYNNSNSCPAIISNRFFNGDIFLSAKKIKKETRFHLIIASSNGIKTTSKSILNIFGLNFRYWVSTGNYNKKIPLAYDYNSRKYDLPLMSVNRTYKIEMRLESINLKWFQYDMANQEVMPTRLFNNTYKVACAYHQMKGLDLTNYYPSKQMHLQTAPSTFKISLHSFFEQLIRKRTLQYSIN